MLTSSPVVHRNPRFCCIIGGCVGGLCNVGELVPELWQADIGRVRGGVFRRERAVDYQGRKGREEGER